MMNRRHQEHYEIAKRFGLGRVFTRLEFNQLYRQEYPERISAPISSDYVATSNRLEEMLYNAAFAFLILTAEDEQADGGLSRFPREPHIMYSSLATGHMRWARRGPQWQGHEL
jgi:hypothetical protein